MRPKIVIREYMGDAIFGLRYDERLREVLVGGPARFEMRMSEVVALFCGVHWQRCLSRRTGRGIQVRVLAVGAEAWADAVVALREDWEVEEVRSFRRLMG